MALNYTTLVAQLSNMMVVASSDPNFQIFLPNCIDYAEQRMYRELDLITTTVIDSNTITSSGVRLVTLSTAQGAFVVVEEVAAYSSAGTTSSNGTRIQLIPTTREFINIVYPSNALNNGVPTFYNLLSNTQLVVGPTPDAPYRLEVTGTMRPTSLSSGNSSTFLSVYLPDVFIAACMVYATGYQRDWGAQANDPQSGQSWENQYQILKGSALIEEARKKWTSEGWTSESPAPVATPKRV
jgi:hypothetical protein